ncbi:MAG TPA: SAM-dependent methyltransferase [Acidobacteriota bacterium]|nr:SAM-dependent methyltransferase [Acidobacteriota bacterium]
MRRLSKCVLTLVLFMNFQFAAAAAADGKFYIVGMGTAPDLITLRGVEAIKSADIILLEEPSEKIYWSEFIGDKEVWYCPHGSRVGFGIDLEKVRDSDVRAILQRNARQRQETVDKIKAAVAQGKIVASLQGGDAMIYGTTFYLEMLPEGFPSEIIPGIGAIQAASAAVKMSPVYGYDTNSVIVTMDDWPGRKDVNEKLMATRTSMVFYTMNMNYPRLFEKLNRHYPPSTPVAVVSYAGDRQKQRVVKSTVGQFMEDIDYKKLAADAHLLMVGKFLTVGQARYDALIGADDDDIDRVHGATPTAK